MNTPRTNRFRFLRYGFVGLGLCVTLAAFYYTEELWRGKRAWDNCKRTMEGQGVDLNWADYVPAPVPADENFFAVPEMQQWFVGRGPTELSKKTPTDVNWWTNRMVVAKLSVGQPGSPAPNGYAVLRWNASSARGEAARLLTNAVGPTANAPRSPFDVGFMIRRLEEIRPARIFLQCETAPTEKELKEFLPDSILVHAHDIPEKEALKFEPAGSGAYDVTLPVLETTDDYLSLTRPLEPQFAVIRHAMQRPSARMEGNYTVPNEIPIPNFVTVRAVAQTLASRAQCDFLLGQPEEALRDLTLLHDMCPPIMEENKPMTLIGSMINVAVNALYADTIADGIQFHAWREPQLVVLEEQLKQVKLLGPIKQSFKMETVFLGDYLPNVSVEQLADLIHERTTREPANSWEHQKNLMLARLVPRGWIYQNAVASINLRPNVIAAVDPANEIIFTDKIAAFQQSKNALLSRWSPDTFLGDPMAPNFTKACQKTARSQTKVNQAIIGCALERYHLAHGQYPETLAALIPQYIDTLPHDVIGGGQLHYRCCADGTFLLYSIGWDARDHGGVRGKSDTDGDWVWPYGP